MAELPKTQEELDAVIEEKINAKVEELTKKHNDEMANLRTSHKKEIEKIQSQSNMSAEEKAKKLAEEKNLEIENELNELRAYKKTNILKDRLSKENLPSYFANDSRLLNAEEGDLDKVIKVVKGEYEASLPKGNTKSTVVPTNTSNPQVNDKKDNGIDGFAEVLGQVINK